jgi:hypothetical protein
MCMRTPTLHLCNTSNPPTPRAPCVRTHQRTCKDALLQACVQLCTRPPGRGLPCMCIPHHAIHPCTPMHVHAHALPTCIDARAQCMRTPPIAIYSIQLYITHPCMHACLYAHACTCTCTCVRSPSRPSHNLQARRPQLTDVLHARAWHAILSRDSVTRFCAWPRLSPIGGARGRVVYLHLFACHYILLHAVPPPGPRLRRGPHPEERPGRRGPRRDGPADGLPMAALTY